MTETLWAVVIGGAIGVVGSVIGYRGLMRVQKETDKRERRMEAHAVLGDIRALIDELSPDDWALWGSAEVELFQTYADRWAVLRPRFIALRVLYPDQRGEVEKAYTTMNSLRVEIRLLMEMVRRHDDHSDLRNQAKETQKQARDLVNELMAVVGQIGEAQRLTAFREHSAGGSAESGKPVEPRRTIGKAFPLVRRPIRRVSPGHGAAAASS